MAAIKTEIKGDLLIITCNVGAAAVKSAKLSGTGKNRVVASTGGNVGVDHPALDGLKLGLNLYIPVE